MKDNILYLFLAFLKNIVTIQLYVIKNRINMKNKGNEKVVYNNLIAVNLKTNEIKQITKQNTNISSNIVELYRSTTMYKGSVLLTVNDDAASAYKAKITSGIVLVPKKVNETIINGKYKDRYFETEIKFIEKNGCVIKTAQSDISSSEFELYKNNILKKKYNNINKACDNVEELCYLERERWHNPTRSDINKLYEQLY